MSENRARARARLRLEQEQQQQAPPIQEQQVAPMMSGGVPYPADEESMVGMDQPMTADQKVGLAGMLGSGIGGMIGSVGSVPGAIAGGTAGGALGDLIGRRIFKGEEITPASAGESLAFGLAAEAIPGITAATAKPLARQAWKVMRTALEMPTTIGAKHQDTIIRTALDNGLAVNAKSIDEVGARIKSLSDKVTERAEQLTAQGQTVGIDQVIKTTKDHVRKNLGTWQGDQLVPGDLPDYLARSKFTDKVIKPGLETVAPSGSITPSQSLELKRAIDKQMHKQHLKGMNPNATPGSSIKNDAKLAQAGAQRTVLNRDPIIANLNQQQHPLLNWQEQAGNSLLKRRPGFTDNVLNAAILEAAYRGMPGGVASSLGMARYIGSMPGLKSKVALGLNALARGKTVKRGTNITPAGAEMIMYNELMNNLGGVRRER